MNSPIFSRSGFSLLELLMAMAIFAIAGVSLAEAINVISLTVSEATEAAALREEMRGVLLETTRNANLVEESRETLSVREDIRFAIIVAPLAAQNREGIALENIYTVTVEAFPVAPAGSAEPLDSISTVVYPPIFQ